MSVYQEIDSVVKAVSSISDDTKKIIDNSPVIVGKYTGSISKGASKSIYYFPILISKNVQPQTMSMVSTNLEGSYMSFVSACFAMTPAMNVKDSDIVNVEKYLQLFHQNIGLQNKDELVLSMREDTHEYQMFPNDILNEANGSNISGILGRNSVFNTVKSPDQKLVADEKSTYMNNVLDKHSSTHKYVNNNAERIDDTSVSYDKDGHKIEIHTSKWIDKKSPEYKLYQNKVLKETEKFNSFRPSVVEVEVTFIIGGQPVKVNVPVGIKCVLHPVNPDDLLDHIMESISGKGLLHNFIRYTTGELHSLSDILFGISSIKKRVAKNNDVSKWAMALEKRKNTNKIRNVIPFLAKKPYLPNTSVVLSMEDVAEIERVIGYNLLKDTKRTIKFMSDNFLLSFVIVDEVTQTIYVMYDGHTSFAEIPFSTLKRENDKTKDVVDALIKGIGMGQKI